MTISLDFSANAFRIVLVLTLLRKAISVVLERQRYILDVHRASKTVNTLQNYVLFLCIRV